MARSNLLFEKDSTGDNLCYTGIMLFVGWVLGALLAVGVYLVSSLPTCHDTTVLTTITETITISNSSEVEFDSQEVITCVVYDVPAAICTTLGILLFPAILISIVVYRRHRGDDICEGDKLGLTIVVAGVIAGLIGGVGLILQTRMSTENTAGGAVLLIVVGISVWITLLCSKCYQQWTEEGDWGHIV
jgi:hypothetical protein